MFIYRDIKPDERLRDTHFQERVLIPKWELNSGNNGTSNNNSNGNGSNENDSEVPQSARKIPKLS